MKPEPATGSEAETAYARALPVLQCAATAAGIPTPRLKIVTSLSAQTGGDTTAEIKFNDPENIVLKLPLTAAMETTAAALDHLIAHEVGHAATKDSPWPSRRFLLWVAGMLSLTILLGTLVYSAATKLVQQQPFVPSYWLVGGLLASLIPITGALYCWRMIEYQADGFAVRHLGGVKGARDLFAFVDERRPTRNRAQQIFDQATQAWDTHPSHKKRLGAMEEIIRSTYSK